MSLSAGALLLLNFNLGTLYNGNSTLEVRYLYEFIGRMVYFNLGWTRILGIFLLKLSMPYIVLIFYVKYFTLLVFLLSVLKENEYRYV